MTKTRDLADLGGGFIQAGTGAVQRTVESKLQDVVSVKDFGAVGDGVTDDTAAIQAAVNATTSKILFFPQGTYIITSSIVLKSNNYLLSERATIKVASTPTFDMFYAASKEFITIEGLTIDGGNYTVASNVSLIAMQLCTDITIKRNYLKGMDRFGLGLNGGSRFVIQDNRITKSTAASTQNQAINFSSSAGTPTNIRIERNRLENSAINVSCDRCRIADNDISNWKFGAGITSEQSSSSARLVITGNLIYGGTGTDVNGYTVGGIENWAPYSVISNNVIYSNAGAGIDQGGRYCVVNNNVIFNNGYDGISSRYGSSTYNASGTVYSGNNAFDTSGAGGAQNYGYAEQSSNLNSITLSGNSFDDNSLKPANILASGTSYVGRKLQSSVTYNPPSISAGSSAITDVFLPGARLGDLVQVSFSLDTQGLIISGYVNANNNVKIVFFNPTGSAIDVGSGSLTASTEKTKDSDSV
jgi:hypothetical protein